MEFWGPYWRVYGFLFGIRKTMMVTMGGEGVELAASSTVCLSEVLATLGNGKLV